MSTYSKYEYIFLKLITLNVSAANSESYFRYAVYVCNTVPCDIYRTRFT